MKLRSLAVAAAVLALAVGLSRAGEPPLTPLSQEALIERLDDGAKAPYVLDVRTADEYVSGHVPGAVNIPHDQLASRLAEVPKDRDVVLYCRSGRRAVIAGQVLADNGYVRLEHLQGDIAAWVDQGQPVEKPRDAAACMAALSSGGTPAEACTAH